jgi:hypothetical protein
LKKEKLKEKKKRIKTGPQKKKDKKQENIAKKSKFNWRRHLRGQTDTWVLNSIEEYKKSEGIKKMIRGQEEDQKPEKNSRFLE